MQTLSQQVVQRRKENCINNFKRAHPEVYDWFQEKYFKDLFLQRNSVVFNAEYYKVDSFKPITSSGLPFTDKQGVVDLDEMVKYLCCEGFDARIERGGRWNGLRLLAVSLKGGNDNA